MTQQIVLLSATIFGALSIIFGAFGAHALKKKLTLEQLTSFETGVKYQMYHAIVLLVVGFNFNQNLRNASLLFIIGTILFSFSIYGLVLSDAFGKKMKLLGPVTPIGGLCLLIGWVLLLINFL
ncbi:uncharacterized membrane protein YgdD (TMEM256/DUF423 family) [Tenacibaculum skagerrakense]|uniref:Uncharacterized membrane protein YgdD (TMEM256/DUF423 family) n=1 Tax=Tenacibaculum skagerrakense TaxID=186571 RepID=A0A4V2SLW8_9FLAO|nr:DUF423 domain-containing protein [Tenacibaculum skagerrakense]TCP25096.1 uncharacterized membrane protein YgdD (TMEM256/DUF423 family) [Tenacibaculum skagerrakense]